jgi:hypothetical protein
MPSDELIYANSMAQIRFRINFIKKMMRGECQITEEDQFSEIIFVQFRKVLELIAFASLSANKEKYSEVHFNFAKHWKAKAMLAEMATMNPNFYPSPVRPDATNLGHKFIEVTDGFLTQDDFVCLYQHSSEVLHVRNPYREGDNIIDIKLSLTEWVSRIQRLLSCHVIGLLNGDIWLINIPEKGDVGLTRGSPA